MAESEEFNLDLTMAKKRRRKAADSKTPENDSESTDYSYMDLLTRLYSKLRAEHPQLVSKKKYTIPAPIVKRGNKRTTWYNFMETTQTLRRNPDHLRSFIIAELGGGDAAVDGQHRLVINGRYQSVQLQSVITKYVNEYVKCKMCNQLDTTLTKDAATRLYFVNCDVCASSNAVGSIVQGFHATTKIDRKRIA